MPDYLVTTPDGQRFKLSLPEEAQGARETAAQRVNQAVRPEGGRKEGAISAWIDSQGGKVKQAIEEAFLHPEHLVNAGPLGALRLVPTTAAKEIGYGMSKHVFDIIDDAGKRVGFTRITYNPNKSNITVDYIESAKPRETQRPGSLGYAFSPEANTLGPREIKSLLPAAKEAFPDAQSVSGFRVTGARGATGEIGGMTLPLPGSKVKPEVEARHKIDPEIADSYMRQWESAAPELPPPRPPRNPPPELPPGHISNESLDQIGRWFDSLGPGSPSLR